MTLPRPPWRPAASAGVFLDAAHVPHMLARPLAVGREVYAVLRHNFATVIAGSIAFSAFVSLLPLLALAVVVATALGGPEVVNRAVEGADPYLTRSAQTLLVEALENGSERVGASAVSLALVIWSALRVFRGLDTAFSLLYGTAHVGGFLDGLRDGLAVLTALVLALVATAAASTLVTVLPSEPVATVAAPLVLVAGLALAFLPMYYVFPDVDVTVSEVVPGVLVAAVGWTVLVRAFQLYAGVAGQYDVYGAVGAVLLVLLWLYLAGLLLLAGAAVNVVLAGRHPASEKGRFAARPPESVHDRP